MGYMGILLKYTQSHILPTRGGGYKGIQFSARCVRPRSPGRFEAVEISSPRILHLSLSFVFAPILGPKSMQNPWLLGYFGWFGASILPTFGVQVLFSV